MGGRTRPPYPPEFRAEAVRLVRDGGTLSGVARDLGVLIESLRAWSRQADVDAGRKDGLTTEEREELTRLRRRVRVIEQVGGILVKGTAFFIKEHLPVPYAGSRSFWGRKGPTPLARRAAGGGAP